MRRFSRIVFVLGLLMMVVSNGIMAQDEEAKVAEEEESPFSAGIDIVSSYVWRGGELGGSSMQPFAEFSKGGFTMGAWGSYDFSSAAGLSEADLYLSYGFDFGLSVGITDYYFHGSSWLEFGDSISSHAFELNVGYEYEGLSIAANYYLNDSRYGAGTDAGTMYFELGYSFGNVSTFIGAGDGWHTSTSEFEVCNIGLSVSKEIKFSDKFSLPITGLISMNPQQEVLHVAGIISF